MPESSTAPLTALNRVRARLRTTHDQDHIDEVLQAEKDMRHAQAVQAARIVELTAKAEAAGGYVVGTGSEEIGWLLGLSSRAATHLVDTCESLVSRPQVWEGLYSGLVDRPRALKIVQLLADVPEPLRTELEALALTYGSTHTTAELHRRLLRMTCDNDPEEIQRREALDARGVALVPRGHGMSSICIDVSSEQADAFMQGLDEYAQNHDCDPYGQGESRTLDQRRADALVGLIADRTRWDVHVQVTIPADMLMGVETRGAELNGSPATHALALELAWSPDARWTRLVTDPLTGTLMDVGSATYEIPKKLRTAVRLRDEVCRWPGCSRKAEFTDTDHAVPHRESHWTAAEGLVCLCRYHHRLKTFGDWRIGTDSSYAEHLRISSPLGMTRCTRPKRYPQRD